MACLIFAFYLGVRSARSFWRDFFCVFYEAQKDTKLHALREQLGAESHVVRMQQISSPIYVHEWRCNGLVLKAYIDHAKASEFNCEKISLEFLADGKLLQRSLNM